MKIELILLMAASGITASAQGLTAAAPATSPTQAVLAYRAPDSNPCGIEVSESPTYYPLVHDVNSILFPGSNLDSRAGALSAGLTRIVVVGARVNAVAADGRTYSRALQQNTVHYYRITCSSQTAAGTFTTKVLPFGATYQDLLPLKGDGTYNWPSTSATDRTETIVDSQTGVLIRRVNLPSDNAPSSAPFPQSGGFDIFCNNALTPQGNWLCAAPDYAQGIYNNLYSINPTTGAAAFLGYAAWQPANVDPNGASLYGILGGVGAMWDYSVGNVAYKPYTVIAFSVTPITIPTILPALVTLTVSQSHLSYLTVGRKITVADGNNPATNYMSGTVSSYAGTTLVVNVTGTHGSGTISSWALPYRNSIVKYTYTGGDIAENAPVQAASTVVDMLGSTAGSPGYNLTDLAYAFNNNFDESLFQNCQFVTFQSHYFLFTCYRNNNNSQDSYSWNGAYDIGNGLPLGRGGDGHVVALTRMWANSGSRWCGNHTNDYLGNVAIMGNAGSNLNDGAVGLGPYQTALSANVPPAVGAVSTTGTLNGTTSVTLAGNPGVTVGQSVFGNGVPFGATVRSISGVDLQLSTAAAITASSVVLTFGSLTTISVTSSWNAAWGPIPPGYAPGEPVSQYPDNFLQTAQPGDMFQIDAENVMLYAKNSSTSWTIMRGIIASYTGVGGIAHSSGAAVRASCQSANNVETAGGGYVWWDFVGSPDGSDPAYYAMNFGSHPVSRGMYTVDSSDYVFRTGVVTDRTAWGINPQGRITTTPTFAGHVAAGTGNSFQKHPSMASGSDYSVFDHPYWVGTSLYSAQSSTAVSPIMGTLYQYNYPTGGNYSAGLFTRPDIEAKYFPTVLKTYQHSFVDVSGPGSVISGGSADNWKYCIAHVAGECVGGSVAGNIYFNHPSLSMLSPWCTGGENGTSAMDICIGSFWPGGLAAMQYKIVNDTTGGSSYRPLTRSFESFEQPGAAGTLSDNLKLTYDGNWALLFLVDNTTIPNQASRIFALKVPPNAVSDGIDRSTFVPAVVPIVAPGNSGIEFARVKFGYAEQGSAASYFCTSRREPCVAVSATVDPTNPFSYLSSDTYRPTPCSYRCSISIPVYPLHTAYYSVEFLDSLGNVVATTQGVAMENTVVSEVFESTLTFRGHIPTLPRGDVIFRGGVGRR